MNEMPIFNRKGEEDWIQHRMLTANLIRYFWDNATEKERSDYRFITFLMKCGWLNHGKEGTTARWRNLQLAKYLKTEDENQLLEAILKQWPKMNKSKISYFLKQDTGVTNYRPSLRPSAEEYVKEQIVALSKIFSRVASVKNDSLKTIMDAMAIIDKLPPVKLPGKKKTSIINAITPCLSCLDPQKRFPIMNNRTKELLKALDIRQDAKGAKKLYELIGQYNIKNNIELDIYSQKYKFPINKAAGGISKKGDVREVGLKSEENSAGNIDKQKTRIRKEHNKLINKFSSSKQVYCYVLEEGYFDLLIKNWKNDRALLIEAKTSSTGVGGRSQVRQAIGQLFDYRRNYIEGDLSKIDLALLLPSEPDKEVAELLYSLEIHILWFDGKKIIISSKGKTNLF
ncbi:MAG: hypothetical protein WA063_07460 [Minisyncoccia bacterium]